MRTSNSLLDITEGTSHYPLSEFPLPASEFPRLMETYGLHDPQLVSTEFLSTIPQTKRKLYTCIADEQYDIIILKNLSKSIFVIKNLYLIFFLIFKNKNDLN